MNNVRTLHEQAMDLAEQAAIKKLRGDSSGMEEILQRALALEAKAAGMVADDMEAEPTRSVLHRSAATLAVQCGELKQAEKLIAVAQLGVIKWELSGGTSSNSVTVEQVEGDGTDAFYGLGIDYTLNERFTLSLKHTVYDLDNVDASTTSAGLTWRWGSK